MPLYSVSRPNPLIGEIGDRINYLIPDEGTLISPQNGFFVGGLTYINPNDAGGADIAMIAPPLTMARIEAAGFLPKPTAEATKLASYDDAGDLRGFGQDLFDDDANGSYLGWYFVFEDDSKNQDITLSSGAIFRGVQS